MPFRPNYDGTKTEPVVLPARIPNLLVNGATGIAVGMATNIPPHNLAEVCTALVKLIDNPELTAAQLCRWIKGPDFPTGGQILNTAEEMQEIYRTGTGSIRLRATWEAGPVGRAEKTIYITSIPYTVDKSALVERIGDVALSRKLPHLVDVKDLSTDDVRIALELKRDADEKMVMAYLFKHTPLQTNFAVNLTCLVPTENAEVGRPERLDLKQMLWHFLHFRLDVVTRPARARARAAEEAHPHPRRASRRSSTPSTRSSQIIRKSDGKADAAEKIIKRFELDADQTDAILELKIYRLARLEILVIQKELKEKRTRARQIDALLKDDEARWRMVRDELEQVQKRYGDTRRTRSSSEADETEYTAEDFIVEEDNVVIVSRDGWVKRQKEVKDLATTRLREGDSVLAVLAGSTRAHGGVLHQLRRRLHRALRRHARPRPDTASRCRACSSSRTASGSSARVQPRPARGVGGPSQRRQQCREAPAAGARPGRDERRLQPALLACPVARAEHALRPAVRPPGRRRRSRGGLAS